MNVFVGKTPINLRSVKGLLQMSKSSLAPFVPEWIRLPWWFIAVATHKY